MRNFATLSVFFNELCLISLRLVNVLKCLYLPAKYFYRACVLVSSLIPEKFPVH